MKETNFPPEEKKGKKKKKKQSNSIVEKSKSAQVMFKTSLRNHIDLTNIADNKANIMLSINAIIITIALPLLSSNAPDHPELIVPASFLLVTSMVSIIYGTLVTRPIKMNGFTQKESIKKGKSNLFFFGNFYNMSIEDYQEGVREIVNDEILMDQTIMTDLYYLGQALGKKYELLRKCYTVFMIGITLTVISFAITYFFTHPHN